jgi:transcriptional regulator with XRE-family HTH domain
MRELRGETSQVSMARKIGVSQPTYSCWEAGVKMPLAIQIRQISITCGISTDWLLGLSDRRDGAVQTIIDPALEHKVSDLEAENAKLKDELLRLKGENAGLNKALEMLAGRK